MVFTDPAPQAYVLAGGRDRRGRIVVSTGMLAALPEDERRALLVHERAHIRHHHHRYQRAAACAATINPLYRPPRTEIGFQIERWADESAAAHTGRAVTARSLAHVGTYVCGS